VVAEYGLAAARVRAGSEDGEELVEVTLDLEDDDTIVLRSVKPDGAALGSMRLPAVRPSDIADGGVSSSSSVAVDSPDVGVPADEVLAGARSGGQGPRAAVLVASPSGLAVETAATKATSHRRPASESGMAACASGAEGALQPQVDPQQYGQLPGTP
jgi:hypothetical protein